MHRSWKDVLMQPVTPTLEAVPGLASACTSVLPSAITAPQVANLSTMSESDGAPERKSQRLSAADTSQTSYFAATEGCVVIGERIRAEASHRSNLLSGLGNTQGLANLPAGVSREDFNLWQTACATGCKPSTEELAIVLKVRIYIVAHCNDVNFLLYLFLLSNLCPDQTVPTP